METEFEMGDRHRIERMKAKIPPISWALMPFIILGGGILIGATFFAIGAEFVYVWPTFAVVGFAILSLNGFIVRKRLENLAETHRVERIMLKGALKAQRAEGGSNP